LRTNEREYNRFLGPELFQRPLLALIVRQLETSKLFADRRRIASQGVRGKRIGIQWAEDCQVSQQNGCEPKVEANVRFHGSGDRQRVELLAKHLRCTRNPKQSEDRPVLN